MIDVAQRRHHRAVLGIFDDATCFLGGEDVRCPTCTRESNPDWRGFETISADTPHMPQRVFALAPGGETSAKVSLFWMRCANEDCKQLIIRIQETHAAGGGDEIANIVAWLAFPRFGQTRPINSLVPEPFRTDYLEASAILDISHRMAAVLARRILGDLLKKYAGKNDKRLTGQIDAFLSEPGHPSGLTSNLHHFREVGDFAAHTQQDQTDDTIIDVDRDEAEWTLDLVDSLFDYFIVQPAKHEAIRQRMDAKIARAGRKPLRTADDEVTGTEC